VRPGDLCFGRSDRALSISLRFISEVELLKASSGIFSKGEYSSVQNSFKVNGLGSKTFLKCLIMISMSLLKFS
jgi:hypothetical protein